MGEMASQQERLQLVETGQPKHGEGETNSQREAEGRREGPLGGMLNAILHRPSADDVTRPPLFSIHLTLFFSFVPLDLGSGTGYYPVLQT